MGLGELIAMGTLGVLLAASAAKAAKAEKIRVRSDVKKKRGR